MAQKYDTKQLQIAAVTHVEYAQITSHTIYTLQIEALLDTDQQLDLSYIFFRLKL